MRLIPLFDGLVFLGGEVGDVHILGVVVLVQCGVVLPFEHLLWQGGGGGLVVD